MFGGQFRDLAYHSFLTAKSIHAGQAFRTAVPEIVRGAAVDRADVARAKAHEKMIPKVAEYRIVRLDGTRQMTFARALR